jgi:hypothetical protein
MTTEKKSSTFDMSSCIEMMKEMMSQGDASCDCEDMMSQFMEQLEIPGEWHEMMSKMGSCCGTEGADRSAS